MKEALYLLALLFIPAILFSQTTYRGFIGTNPIELCTDIYTDGDARAIYAYTDFDEPVVIKGSLQNGKLSLYEKNKSGRNKAVLTFDAFKADAKELKGKLRNLNTGKQMDVRLTKTFSIAEGDSVAWKDREILQPVSLPGRYFKLILSKTKGDDQARVRGIKIIEKKTDRLTQRIDLDCQLWGLNNVCVGDFNFDGVTDFSVFEQSYAGPNTSSLYFLYDKKKDRFVNSGFQGVSLEFDAKTKRILEHNQCCAGNGHMNAEYKVVKNKMVLIKKTCTEYDETKKDFVKVKCE